MLFEIFFIFLYCFNSCLTIRSNSDPLSNPKSIRPFLVHHWPMNGNTTDVVGEAHMINGVNVGYTKNRHNVENRAMLFASGYYSLPSRTYFTQSDFTITVWINLAKFSKYASILDIGNGRDSDNVVFRATSDTSNRLEGYIFNGATEHGFRSSSVIPTGRWTHLALVFERSTMYLYHDAYIIAQRSSTHQLRNVVRTKSLIGGDSWPHSENFIGAMDDLRIYHTALTTSEIMQVMSETI